MVITMFELPVLTISQWFQLAQIVAMIFFWLWGRYTVNSIMDAVFGAFEEIPKKATMSALGTLSGKSRQAKKVGKAVLQDLIAQNNPALSAILQAFPSVKELVMENPQLVPIALQFLQGMQNSGNGSTQLLPSGAGNSGIVTSLPQYKKFDMSM